MAHNNISNCQFNGIDLWASEQTTVAHNTVVHCEYSGINLEGGESPSNSIIHNNTIAYNTRGINFERACNNIVAHNTIINNTDYGIALSHLVTALGIPPQSYRWDSDDNTVKENDFLGNNPSGSSQAFDEGENNTFVHNYWADHDKTDLNEDGIADNPYPIAGEAENHDPTPLTAFANPHRLLTTSIPLVESFTNSRGLIGILLMSLLLTTILVKRGKRKSK